MFKVYCSSFEGHRVRFHTPNYQPKPRPPSITPREPITVPKDAEAELPESEVSSHVTQSELDTTRSRLPEEEPEEDTIEGMAFVCLILSAQVGWRTI